MKYLAIFILFILLLAACAPAAPATPAAPPTPNARPMPTGAWLGETPPDASPKLFSTRLMSYNLHSPPSFSPDGTEVYWSDLKNGLGRIKSTRLVDGVWTEPQVLSLSGSNISTIDPWLSPDGSRLYFMSDEPIPGVTTFERATLWFAQRQGERWGQPQPMPAMINGRILHWMSSITNSGDLYFAGGTQGVDTIYLSRYVNGEYTASVALDAPINTPDMDEYAPAVDPAGKFLLFTRLKSYDSMPRLFISYALPDGKWSEPVMVENIPYCAAAVLSPDGKYIFYLSSPDHVSWRDTSFIEELRPKY
jgi:hypothetical protein